MRALLLLGFVVFFSSLFSSCELEVLRGVSPQDASLYKPTESGEYVCKGTGEKIPFSKVNDNYCNCETEGDDEPGTSACEKGKFYCQNLGHQPKTIFSSFVNDGICDCCDGSDEYTGTSCPNKCSEFAAESRKQREEELRLLEEGVKLKQKLIGESEEALQVKKLNIIRLTTDLEPKKVALRELEARKNAAEEAEKKILGAREAEKQERELQKQKAQEELQKKREEAEKLTVPYIMDPFMSLEDQAHLIPGMVEALEEAKAAEAKEAEAKAIEASKTSEPPKTEEPTEAPKSAEEIAAEELRTEYNKESAAVSEAERQIQVLTEEISRNAGRNNEYRHLIGKCFNGHFAGYSYEVCPFDKTSQTGTSLGRFEKWEGDNAQLFTNGQQCWGGPMRSNKVIFICGVEEKLVAVIEPSKCVYETTFSTPAACDENRIAQLKQLDQEVQHEGLLNENQKVVFT